MGRVSFFWTLVVLFVTSATFTAPALAQSYDVLYVDGQVRNYSTDSLLQTGDRIFASDSLVFAAPTDVVHAISPTEGRVRLQPMVQKRSSEIFALVRNVLFAPMQRRHLSTRASARPWTPDDLRAYFESATLLLVGPTPLPSPVPCCPVSDTSFFYVRYQWNGSDVNKKLPAPDGTPVLVEDSLYRVDGARIAPNAARSPMLYYYQSQNSYPVASLHLAVPDLPLLRREIRLLLRHIRGEHPLGSDPIVDEVEAYLLDTGRRVPRTVLQTWLPKQF